MLKIIENIGKRGALCECLQCQSVFKIKCKYTSKKSYLGCICTDCKNGIVNVTELSQIALKKWFTYNPVTGHWIYNFTTRSGKANEDATSNHSSGYRTIRVGSIDYLAHRCAFLYMENYLPDQVDHIDHDKSNNSWNNLRPVSPRENSMNCTKSVNNSTGITGVALHVPTGKYRAYINDKGKQIHLGLYPTLQEAQEVREKANVRFKYHTNHGK